MRIAIAFACALFASSASAACFGLSSFQTCSDSSGNRYTVNRMGNTTYMRGNNYNTGSSWSQRSTTLGGTTLHNGYDSNGNSWSTRCYNGRCY